MALLYDYKSKNWVDTPDNEVAAKIAAGTHGLESGIDVPVVSPDGTAGTIRSDEAANAFKEGFRLSTPEDIRKSFADTATEHQAQIYDDPLAAGAAGILRGATLGGSDVALNAMGLAPGVEQLREQNPISSIAGEVGGVVANPIIGAGLQAVGRGAQAATGAGTLAREAGVATEALASPGRVLASKLAGGAVQGAAEGAFLGAGQGVSEAALGDPNQVAENLFAGVKNGALFGGGLGIIGSGLSAAKEPLFDFTSRVTNKVDDIVQSVARRAAKTSLIPTFTEKEMQSLTPLARELIDQPEFRKAAFEGGLGKFNDAVAETEKAAVNLDRDLAANRKELDRHLRSMPADVQADAKHLVEEARGDILQARASGQEQAKSLYSAVDNVVQGHADTGAQQLKPLISQTRELIERLESSGDARAVSKAREMQQALDATVPKSVQDLTTQKVSDEGFKQYIDGLINVPAELDVTRRLRSLTPNKFTHDLADFSPSARSAFADYRNKVDGLLKNYPLEDVQKSLSEADRYYNASNALSDFVGKNKILNPKSLIAKMQLPEQSAQFNTIIDRLSEFQPELQKVRESMNDAVDKKNAIEAFQDALRSKKADVGSGMTAEDIEGLAKILGPSKKLGEALNEMKSNEALKTQLASMGNDPIGKLMLIKKTAGMPITAELQELQNHTGAYEKLAKLGSSADAIASRDPSGRLAGLLSKAAGAGYVAQRLHIPGSGLIGGAVGAASKLSSGLNPYNTLQTLTKIEAASRQAANRINKGVMSAVDGLTSDKVRRAATIIEGRKTLDEKRETFNDRAKQLADFSVNHMQDQMLAKNVGSIPDAPGISESLQNQAKVAGSFLLTKLPKDPLAGQTLFGMDTGWQPSDMELSKFERYSDAVEHPMQVLNNIADGHATPEEIETIQAVYPNMYNNLQKQLTNAIVERGKDMTYQQKLTLSQMYNLPADVTMQPEFVQSMQDNFAEKGSPQQGSQPAGEPGPKVHVARLDLNIDNIATPTQLLTAGKTS